jgi:hypothetical protein
MKNINDVLQFKIGEESYEREFEIIPIPPYEFVENNLSLEPYEYFGNINEILGINFSSTIILYYNADILMRVEYKIKGNIIEKLVKNIEEMNLLIPESISLMVSFNKHENITLLKYENLKLQELQ